MRITPDHISSLQPGEIFVFGSNLHGKHHGGAARFAHQHFGAVMGQGIGMAGQSYAIPTTMRRGLIGAYAKEFVNFAKERTDLRFYLTAVGCGIAGYTPKEVAPLFVECLDMDNVWMPQSFLDVLKKA